MTAVHRLDEARVPPQATEIEEQLIGTLLFEPRAFTEVADILIPEAFYDSANGQVFASMCRLAKRGDPIDIGTVIYDAKACGMLEVIGGPMRLTKLSHKATTAASVRYHALIVAQKYIARQIIDVSSRALDAAYDDTNDVFDVLSIAQLDLMKLNEIGGPTERTASDIAREVVDTTEPDRGVPTFFANLDRHIRFEPGTVTIVGARPGMGKTAFALSLAWRQVAHGATVYFASMEMRDTGLVNRLICGECGVPVWKAKRKMLSEEQNDRRARFAMEQDAALKRLVIDETPAMDTSSLLARIDRNKRKRGASIVFVDYLQLMNVRGERFKDRYARVTAVSEQLRIIAKQTDLPLVVLSQLNRRTAGKPGEGTKVSRPSMSDLRESGQIEQDAEGILLLHRPKYYDPLAGDELEVIIAKNRDGKDTTENLLFDAEGVRVVDPPPGGPEPGIAGRPHYQDDNPF